MTDIYNTSYIILQYIYYYSGLDLQLLITVTPSYYVSIATVE